jgi:hypothetical protein
MTFSELTRHVSSLLMIGPLHELFVRTSVAASASPRLPNRRLPSTCQSKEHCWASAVVFTSATLLLSCSTALVTENTLDVSTTTDDLTSRQIIFNLVKIKQNQYALPSQVQITSGSVDATTSITPSVSPAFFPSRVNTIGTSSTSTTITGSNAVTRPATTTSLSGNVSSTDSWITSFLQDPQQLRRLSYLYQYGASQLSSADLLCRYPIPEQSKNQQQQNSIGQQPASGPKLRYVRVVAQPGPNPYALGIISCHPGSNVAVLVGNNPDPAFLHFPDCIICAIPDKRFDAIVKQTIKNSRMTISSDPYISATEDYNDTFEYVPVILNPGLAPNSQLLLGAPPITSQASKFAQKVDWLSIVKNGVDPIPNEAKRIGGSDGYTVYIHPLSVQSISPRPQASPKTGDEHFSEFVLAIMEALRQPAELQTVGATPPPITQSTR